MSESALLVVVPEAEPWVRSLRSKFDPSARVGVPAHITVLYPFMPLDGLSSGVSKKLRATIATLAPFSFELGRIERFTETTYLAPDPAEPFALLTAALVHAFPNYQPYGGRYAEVTPHLTVAGQSEEFASIAERDLAVELGRRGKIHAECRSVELFEKSEDGYWRRYESFELGRGA